MSVTNVMGNQELYVVWKILNILNILMRTIYLALPPLIVVKIIMVMKVTNLLLKEVISQIAIHHLQCMLAFHNIKSKGLMLIRPRTSLGKLKTSVWHK